MAANVLLQRLCFAQATRLNANNEGHPQLLGCSLAGRHWAPGARLVNKMYNFHLSQAQINHLSYPQAAEWRVEDCLVSGLLVEFRVVASQVHRPMTLFASAREAVPEPQIK